MVELNVYPARDFSSVFHLGYMSLKTVSLITCLPRSNACCCCYYCVIPDMATETGIVEVHAVSPERCSLSHFATGDGVAHTRRCHHSTILFGRRMIMMSLFLLRRRRRQLLTVTCLLSIVSFACIIQNSESKHCRYLVRKPESKPC